MIKKLLILFFIFNIFTYLFAQVPPPGGPPSTSGTIYFQYDTSGNQKSRAWCLNCANKTVMTKVKDSVEVESMINPIDEIESNIIAYPNPVRDYLQLKWVENPIKQPNNLYLFSMDSKIVFQKQINKKQGQTQVPLHKYPSGTYILLVEYTDGKKESFKIIKT